MSSSINSADNPKDLLEAHVRTRRELQLSYFQKVSRVLSLKQQPQLRGPPHSRIKCLYCVRPGHTTTECHLRNSLLQRSSQKIQYNQGPSRPHFSTQQFPKQQSPKTSPCRTNNIVNKQRPPFNPHTQSRPNHRTPELFFWVFQLLLWNNITMKMRHTLNFPKLLTHNNISIF